MPPARSLASFVLNASFSLTLMLTFTFGCAAMYSSASAFHSDSPGSLFWMWYQSISTGSSATEGAADGAAVRPIGALDGAVLGLDPEHAAVMIATTAIVLASLRYPKGGLLS